MYKIGDIFVYGSNGVCKITDIKQEDFCGREKTYYILAPIYDQKETIFVPVDNEKLVSKMKKLLTPDEIIALIKTIPHKKSVWIENVNMRREAYKKIIRQANRDELITLLKTLYERRLKLQLEGKRLSVCDERFLKQAQHIIHSEIAQVLSIPREEVSPYIEKTISIA